MKITEAMKLGMEKSLPITATLITSDPEGKLYACALGCVHIGVGGSLAMEDSDIYNSLFKLWPELNRVEVEDDPELHNEGYKRPLGEAIWVRNDSLKWTRERTLAWLEGMGY